MLYRLHMENVAGADVPALVSTRFAGFTVQHSVGYWKGVAEPSLTVEIYGSREDAPKIGELAQELRQALGQEAVLVAVVMSGEGMFTEAGIEGFNF